MRITPSEFTPERRTYRARGGRRKGGRTMADRPFIAWDGEGWTEHAHSQSCLVMADLHLPSHDCECFCDFEGTELKEHYCQHHYCLFGSSTGDYVKAPVLDSESCFELMLKVAVENPGAHHVGYAFGYDSNMLLVSLPPKKVRELHKYKTVLWRDYRIEYIPGKWFQVSKDIAGTRVTCRIQDVFSFFGMSFVKALGKWNVGTDTERKSIQSGKDSRGDFSLDSLDSQVVPYWSMELRLLRELAERLRSILYSGGFLVDRWYGPGALANWMYKNRNMRSHIVQELPEPVLDAGQYAYFGGRFEGFKAGLHLGDIYSYDINSAYPYAISLLPSLNNGRWRNVVGRVDVSGIRMGMFKVAFQNTNPKSPGPIPFRKHDGAVRFPHRFREAGYAWVHMPEFRLLLLLEREGYISDLEVFDGWILEDDGSSPFSWVADLYQQRREWKSAGNPAELAAKLGLNSLYGKLAQHIGGTKDAPPTWHQYQYAGHITSTCRAMLFEASFRQWESVIAYETDGIYTTTPLRGMCDSTELGGWEATSYHGMLFLQSGVYWLRGPDHTWLPPKTRGIPQAQMAFESAMAALETGSPLVAFQNQFVKFPLSWMRTSKRGWRTWESAKKEFVFGGDGKRKHDPRYCPECPERVTEWQKAVSPINLDTDGAISVQTATVTTVKPGKGIGMHEGLHTLVQTGGIQTKPPTKVKLEWRDGSRTEAFEDIDSQREGVHLD